MNLIVLFLSALLMFNGITNKIFSKHVNNEVLKQSVAPTSLVTGVITFLFNAYCYRKFSKEERGGLFIEIIVGNLLILLFYCFCLFTAWLSVYTVRQTLSKYTILDIETEFNCCGWEEMREYCMKKSERTCYSTLISPFNTYRTIVTLVGLLSGVHFILLCVGLCVKYKPQRKESLEAVYVNIGDN